MHEEEQVFMEQDEVELRTSLDYKPCMMFTCMIIMLEKGKTTTTTTSESEDNEASLGQSVFDGYYSFPEQQNKRQTKEGDD